MPVTGIGATWDVDLFSSQTAYSIEDIDFTTAPLTSTTATGDVASAIDATDDLIVGDGYAMRLKTTLTLDSSEDIAFYLSAAGDANVYVDGVLVSQIRCETLPGVNAGPCPETGGTVCLCNADRRYDTASDIATVGPGQHEIVVEYLNHVAGDVAMLDWSVGNAGRRAFDLQIPYQAAFVADDALSYQFFDENPAGDTVENIPSSGAVATGVASDFDVTKLANDITFDGDNFAVRYSGQIQIETGGSYTFRTGSDEGSKLYINGFEVVDNDGIHGLAYASGAVQLVAGVHDIQIVYFDALGDEVLDVEVNGADTGGVMRDLFDSGIEVSTVPNPVDEDPNGGGEWQGVQDWPLLSIHAIIMPNFEIMTYGTDTTGIQSAQFVYDVWNYETNTHYLLPNRTGTDLFCSVPFYVPETGKVVISGGDTRGDAPNTGVNDANVYDPDARTLQPLDTGDMHYARWYATAVTLSNGKVALLGGLDGNGEGVGQVEVYTPGVGFKELTGVTPAQVDILSEAWFYPRAYPTSDGRVVVLSNYVDGTLHILDPSGDGALEYYGDVDFSVSPRHSTVMYDKDKAAFLTTDGSLWTLDFSGDAPVSTFIADLGPTRNFGNMMILPTGELLILGGTDVSTTTDYGTPSKGAISWNPATGIVSYLESEALARLYHSTALLLPDGSVMSLGGGAPGPIDNLNAERFRPDYLYDDSGQPAERLVILEAPEDVVQQSDIRFRVSDASAVDRVTMVKNGSVTHTFNMETRFEELSFTVDAEGYIVATPSANSNVFTPGGWMLFVLDDAGVPSHAASVLVGMGGEHFSATAESYYTLSEAAEATAENEFQLTSNAPGERGFVTTNERIDFTEDFLLSTQVNLGTGSEGLTILFQNDPWGVDIAGGGDGGLGAVGIENGFGLLFDVHQNSDETTARHTGFFAVDGGDLVELGTHATPSAYDDGAWHDVEITWDAAAQVLSYTYDGVTMDTVTLDLPALYFSGNAAHLSFTGTTSAAAASAQSVRITGFDGFYESAPSGVEAKPDAFMVDEASTVSGNLLADNGSGADFDARNKTLNVVAVEDQAAGTVTLASGAIVTYTTDGAFTYDPNGAFDGLEAGQTTEDTFLYTIENTDGDQDGQIVHMTVNGADAPPVSAPDASNDTYDFIWAANGRVIANSAFGVLANDTDADGNPLSVQAVGSGQPSTWVAGSDGGQIFIAANGEVRFRDPNGDFSALFFGESASTSVTYTVGDGIHGTDTATVTLNIAGSVEPVPEPIFYGTVTGFYFEDLNEDDTYQNNEILVEDQQVRLFQADGTLDSIIVSNRFGMSRFNDVPYGDYYLEFELPDGKSFVTPNQGSIEGRDSDVTNAALGQTDVFTVDSDVFVRQQAGIEVAPIIPTGALEVFVFDDLSGNDRFGTGDAAMVGVTVKLNNNAGTLAIATTGIDGVASFSELGYGSYYIEVVPPEDMVFVTPNSGDNEAIDSDITDVELGTSQSITINTEAAVTLQAGLTTVADQLGTIDGFVFEDVTRDDTYGAGDALLSGVTVNLRHASDASLVATAVTLSDGAYAFTDLVYGDYFVEVVPPTDMIFVTADQGTDEGADSDITDQELGRSDTITVDSETAFEVQAGLIPTPTGTVQGFVFEDVTRDDTYGAGDALLSGVTVNLRHASDASLVATAVTLSDGAYAFTDLVYGDYFVEVVPPTDMIFVTADQGTDEGADSDITDQELGRSDTLVVDSETAFEVQAGLIPTPTGTVQGFVFEDVTPNGTYGAGDTLLNGVTVNLRDANDDSLVATTTTLTNGTYEFSGLDFGDYYIEMLPPLGLGFVTANQGDDDANDSDITNAILGTSGSFAVGNETPVEIQAGLALVPNGAVNGVIFEDEDANDFFTRSDARLSGVQVNLRRTQDDSLVDSVSTDEGGYYYFAQVPYGPYYIEVEPPALMGFIPAVAGGGEAIPSFITDAASGTSDSFLVDQPWATAIHAGLTKLPSGSVTGYVFDDLDTSDTFNGGDALLSGVTVHLRLSSDDSLVKTTTSGSDGVYDFEDLPYDTYYVEVVLPEGQRFVAANQGDDESIDSDITDAALGRSASFAIDSEIPVELQAGISAPLPTGSIAAFVFNDQNSSDLFDIGDTVRPGMVINMRDDAGALVRSGKTDEYGSAAFLEVAQGDYYLEFMPPHGTVFAAVGAPGDQSFNSDVSNAALGTTDLFTINGGTLISMQAGIAPDPTSASDGSVTGYLFDDRDGSDTYDEAADVYLGGVEVNLLTADGTLVKTTQTTTTGQIIFDNVAYGDYVMQAALPNGFEFVTANQGSIESRDSDIVHFDTGTTDAFSVTSPDVVQQQVGLNRAADTIDPSDLPASLSVLFAGNSYQQNGPNSDQFVTTQFLNLLGDVGISSSSKKVVLGATTLKQLWDEGQVQADLATGTYDVMILNGKNTPLSTTEGVEEFDTYAELFIDLAAANGTETVLFGLWAGDWEIDVTGGDSFAATAHTLYRDAALNHGAAYAPTGVAWADAHAELSALYGNGDNGQTAEDLLTRDAIHSAETGAYLAANVLFETVFDTPPPSPPDDLPNVLTLGNASLMQNIAGDAVADYAVKLEPDFWV